jgi:hypothetical protein
MSTPTLDWTVMIYVAAPDRSLFTPAILLPDKLQAIGSSDRVHVVLQIDTFALPASRFFVNVAGQLPRLVPANIAPVQNTGSVKTFVDFVSWVKENHPAKHYLVIFNGHAQGVQDFPGDESESELDNVAAAAAPSGILNNPAVAAVPSGVLVNLAIASLVPDTRDALTSRELKDALDQACKKLEVDRIDIVGFDACLMSMVEIGMQIQQSARFMVGSEQTIPSNGWPYPEIVKGLIDNAGLEPRPLGELIVDEYLKFYGTPPDKEQAAAEIETLSVAPTIDLRQQIVKRLEAFEADLKVKGNVMLAVCDLSQSPKLSQAIGHLIPPIRQCLAIPELRLAVLKARFDSQFFFVNDFVDIFSFCFRLSETLAAEPFTTASASQPALCQQVETACQEIMDAIHKDDGTGFVAKSGITFPEQSDIQSARGVSIYFPLILPLYRELEFSKETLWDDFLQDYMSKFFFQPDSISVVASLSNLSVDGNGSKPKGGNNVMSSNSVSAAAAARTPCLMLSEGTKITDKATGLTKELTGMSVVDITPEPKVHVPEGTDVKIPGEPGIKAITGTEVKASSGTELKAGVGPAKPLLEMVVPACTLRELTTVNADTDFADGASIVAIENAPIFVVNVVFVRAPLP